MMDEMRIKLRTKFMRNIVSKLIAKFIYKKTGYKIDIQLDDLDVFAINGDTTIKLNMEAKIKSEEFNKFIESLDQD